MVELVRTNDLVLISVIEILLSGAEIAFFIADLQHERGRGIPWASCRAVSLVDFDEIFRARRLLTEAGLAAELRDA